MSVMCAKRRPVFVGAAARVALATITAPAAASDVEIIDRRDGSISDFESDMACLLRRKYPLKRESELLKGQGDVDVGIEIVFGANDRLDCAGCPFLLIGIVRRFKLPPKTLCGKLEIRSKSFASRLILACQ